ncbi:MAG: hypothetical protein ABSA97_16080, partial [Verrucomicrobiia bacterium]
MDGLCLVIVLGMFQRKRSRDLSRRLIEFETQIEFFFPAGEFIVIQATIAEHHVVVGFEVFRIDAQSFLVFGHRVGIFALQEEHASHLISHYAIEGIKRCRLREAATGGLDVA